MRPGDRLRRHPNTLSDLPRRRVPDAVQREAVHR
jgi:hypothetical protein